MMATQSFSSGLCEPVGRGRVIKHAGDRAAQDVLRQIGMEETYPVDLSKIAMRLDAEIVEEPIDGDGYLLELPDDTYEVIVPEVTENIGRGRRTRIRFTIAHELAHHYLNGIARALEESPGDPDVEGVSIEEVPQAEVEQWCDRFASAILMPEPAVKEFIGQASRLSDPELIHRGAHAFRVSYQAWAYRLGGLYSLQICKLSALNPISLDSVPPALRGEQGEQAVRSALQEALKSGQTAGPYVGAVAIRVAGGRFQILGLDLS